MLTTKQRAYLRGLANSIEPILHVGKNGVTPTVIMQADQALEKRELIKGTIQENSALTVKEALTLICENTGAEPVQFIGRKFALYRRNDEKPVINLP